MMMSRCSKPDARSPAPLLAVVIGALLVLCAGFGWWQNHYGRIGGMISPAKVLWLFTALTYFFVVPGWLRGDGALSGPARRLYRVFFAGYVVRGLIEMPMLIWTHAWRVEHGMLHNAIMLSVTLYLRRSWRPGVEADEPARQYLPWLMVAGLAETLNAWLFGRAGSPETGQYFANEDAAFVWINRITWVEICVLVPALIGWLIRYHKGRRTMT